VPNQGVQREIDLFGRRELVGFYNTFAAHSAVDGLDRDGLRVEVCRDRRTGEVHALRAPTLVSLQFHVESILTEDGVRLGADAVRRLLGVAVSDEAAPATRLEATPRP
jgi:phenazine biosynthesis protein phzE